MSLADKYGKPADVHLMIDTDVGVDDATALMMALKWGKVDAVFAVAGNIGLETVCANIDIVLDLMDVAPGDVPTYAGAKDPLFVEAKAANVHGADGLGDTRDRYPEVETSHLKPGFAPDVMIDMVNAAPGKYTLVTLGPMTNLALALRKDPSIATKFAKVIFMGGAWTCKGNVTPCAEYNFWADPHAANVCVRAVDNMVMVGWELCSLHTIPWPTYHKMCKVDNKHGKFFHAITTKFVEYRNAHDAAQEDTGFTTADPLAVCVALFPHVIKSHMEKTIYVETGGDMGRGATFMDYYGNKSPDKVLTKAFIVTEFNTDVWEAMFEDHIN